MFTMKSFISLLMFFTAVHQSFAIPIGKNYWEIHRLVENEKEIQRQEILKKKYQGRHPPPVWIEYATQTIDHFDPYLQENRTFQQLIYSNNMYWDVSNGPVFVLIGGEEATLNSSVYLGQHVQIADEHNALLIGIEHRFYGSSINDDGLELKNLKYLSSQQALADLAEAHEFLYNMFQMSHNNTWICFGGGYAGSLSAWFRIKYPHLVYGAVASSAPIRAQTNFEGYNKVVADSLSDPTVGGNGECLQQVSQAFIQIDGLIKLGNFTMLEKDFHSCGSISHPNDSLTFVSNLAGIVMGIVQYNDQVPGVNIYNLCGVMTTTSNPYYNMGQVNKMFMNATKVTCVDNSYSSFIKNISNTRVNKNAVGIGIRAWTWQTCTQFGFFQTCENRSICPFSTLMTLNSSLAICRDIFKITEKDVEEAVKFTNDYYGADQPKGSRILFVNGSLDPWHTLSVTHNVSDSETSLYINGTSHMADMYFRDNDPQILADARQKIEDQVVRWVRESQPQ